MFSVNLWPASEVHGNYLLCRLCLLYYTVLEISLL